MFKIEKLKYTDFLKYEPNFLSLDISVQSTGWVMSIDGVVTYGTRALETTDELGRRREFRSFLMDLIGTHKLNVVFVEDVIAGTNFKTTKGLIQLNTIIDDLTADNLVDVKEVKRIDNKKWKKYLKRASNYDGDIKKENDKELIQNCLNEIGFDLAVKQDIYDAMGIAVAIIYRDFIADEKPKTDSVLKKDLKAGYTIRQFETKNTKYEKYLSGLIVKSKRDLDEVDWMSEKRDLLYLFKQKIVKEQIDDKIYIVHINSMKLGVLALTKKLSTDFDKCILVITKTKI